MMMATIMKDGKLDADGLLALCIQHENKIERLREACRIALLHAPSIRLAPERRHTIAVLEAALRQSYATQRG